MIDLIFLPLMAGCCLALATGPLGAFIVWRRMAYFGDTIAHGALIGVAFGVLLHANSTLSVVLFAALVASVLSLIQIKSTLPTDTLLGIIAHGSLALGLVFIHFMADQRVDLLSILLGDILTVNIIDIALIAGIVAVVLLVVIYFWREFVLTAIDEDLALAEGHNVKGLRFLLTLLIALVISISVQVVGVLLVTALLIIPAAASSRISSSPESMAVYASLFAILSVIAGLAFSYFYDIPAGASIVACSVLLLLLPNKKMS